MPIDPSRAFGAYAAATTLACAWLALGGQVAAPKLVTLDVARINVREPDGTLRMAISNSAAAPGIIVGTKEYPHPARKTAGMIFYNEEGIENGGLVFDGKKVGGRRTSGGSLTFDRYLQDQVVQATAEEDGPQRMSGVRVFDRPEGAMDLGRLGAIQAIPPGPAQNEAIANNSIGGAQRGFFGRARDGSSRVELRDAAGKIRLALHVQPDGSAAIDFLDTSDRITRSVAP